MKDVDYRNADKTLEVTYREQIGGASMPESHFHDTFEIYYLLSGTRSYFINERTYLVNQGDLVFINMHDLHRTIYAGVPNCKRIVINFKPAVLPVSGTNIPDDIYLPFLSENRVISFTAREQPFVESLFLKILSEVRTKDTCFENMVLSYLIQLLSLSARHMGQNSRQGAVPAQSDPVNSSAARIVQYINSHFTEPLTLASVSSRFFISPFYLCKVFKAYTGFTFIEYLNSLRIKEAQRLLRELGSSISEVSEKVCFGSFTHFGRVFKAYAGMSPRAYRENYRVSK